MSAHSISASVPIIILEMPWVLYESRRRLSYNVPEKPARASSTSNRGVPMRACPTLSLLTRTPLLCFFLHSRQPQLSYVFKHASTVVNSWFPAKRQVQICQVLSCILLLQVLHTRRNDKYNITVSIQQACACTIFHMRQEPDIILPVSSFVRYLLSVFHSPGYLEICNEVPVVCVLFEKEFYGFGISDESGLTSFLHERSACAPTVGEFVELHLTAKRDIMDQLVQYDSGTFTFWIIVWLIYTWNSHGVQERRPKLVDIEILPEIYGSCMSSQYRQRWRRCRVWVLNLIDRQRTRHSTDIEHSPSRS